MITILTIASISIIFMSWDNVIAVTKEPRKVEAIVTAYTSLPHLTDETPFIMSPYTTERLRIIAIHLER